MSNSVPPRPAGRRRSWFPWRRRLRNRDREVLEAAFTAGTLDQDLLDVLPVMLREALPEVTPVVLFIAWSLARHGHRARDLSRMLTLTAEQSRIISNVAQARASSDHRPGGAGPVPDEDPR